MKTIRIIRLRTTSAVGLRHGSGFFLCRADAIAGGDEDPRKGPKLDSLSWFRV